MKTLLYQGFDSTASEVHLLHNIFASEDEKYKSLGPTLKQIFHFFLSKTPQNFFCALRAHVGMQTIIKFSKTHPSTPRPIRRDPSSRISLLLEEETEASSPKRRESPKGSSPPKEESPPKDPPPSREGRAFHSSSLPGREKPVPAQAPLQEMVHGSSNFHLYPTPHP